MIVLCWFICFQGIRKRLCQCGTELNIFGFILYRNCRRRYSFCLVFSRPVRITTIPCLWDCDQPANLLNQRSCGELRQRFGVQVLNEQLPWLDLKNLCQLPDGLNICFPTQPDATQFAIAKTAAAGLNNF